MRKDELLYLHHLLALSRREFERRGVADSEAFEAYDALETGPLAIHAAKREHARAVRTLVAGLVAALEESDDQGQTLPRA